jgi:hypothetical protein
MSLACFAMGTCGWIFHKASTSERAALIAAGALLMYGSVLTLAAGAAFAIPVVILHAVRRT